MEFACLEKKAVLKWSYFVHSVIFRCIMHSLWFCHNSKQMLQSRICAYHHVNDVDCCPCSRFRYQQACFCGVYMWLTKDHMGRVKRKYAFKHTQDDIKTYLLNSDPLKPHFYIVKLGFTGVYIIFLFLLKNIDCGYSLEPPPWGGSNEYPQSMLSSRNMKNIRVFYLNIFMFLVVKFSIYLNRRARTKYHQGLCWPCIHARWRRLVWAFATHMYPTTHFRTAWSLYKLNTFMKVSCTNMTSVVLLSWLTNTGNIMQWHANKQTNTLTCFNNIMQLFRSDILWLVACLLSVMICFLFLLVSLVGYVLWLWQLIGSFYTSQSSLYRHSIQR